MSSLIGYLSGLEPFEEAVSRAGSGRAEITAPSFVHPFVIAGLLSREPWRSSVVVVIAPDQDSALEFEHELGLYCSDRAVVYLPPRGVWFGSEGEVKPRVAARRARALAELEAGRGRSAEGAAGTHDQDPGAANRGGASDDRGAPVLVIEASTLLEGVAPPLGRPLTIEAGSQLGFEDLVRNLVDLGYGRVDQVEDAGEFSVRGGIVDVFPATGRAPVRVEFWGDEVESLRAFSVYSQRSLGTLEQLKVFAAGEDSHVNPVPVVSLLPRAARLIQVDPARARARVDAFETDLADLLGGLNPPPEGEASEALRGGGAARGPAAAPGRVAGREAGGAGAPESPGPKSVRSTFADAAHDHEHRGRTAWADAYSNWATVSAQLEELPLLTIGTLGLAPAEGEAAPAPHMRATSGELPVTSLPEAEGAIQRLVNEGYRVVIAFEHRAEAERASYVLRRITGVLAEQAEVGSGPGVTFLPRPHRRHFMLPDARLALLTEAMVFPRRHKAVSERRPLAGAELSSFRDLRKGDFVVHEDHGLGRFEGISTKSVAGVTRDYLDLAFKDGDMLYVPHDQISKVMRYVGAGAAAPALSKLGGKAWEHVKSRARKAARQVAGELLHLYAQRQAVEGYRFSEDGEWQNRFEKAFPYDETEDQLRAIDQIKDDMESGHPMDRLLCGDVGYGKTEVALRAAFKASLDGKQVMVLVPTTILAQQHYGTFRERFAEFPVTVEMISRFRSASEQKVILRDFAAGKVDIIIGTHRLLSQDVRPKDLGLVIVDEEQRFGVAQKEALRRLKVRVDVLTLSATPIPRTLQMSMSGVRDITVIETPPRDRHPIQTYVGMYDEGMVTRAIAREIDRGGQVYYLHNRVETIDKAARRLQELMPKVRFAVAHGQMNEHELEGRMLDFLRGDTDVLVSTTIIESGLDIPNANTLIVERADLLGLAQLYQIRGRIGRSSRVAHAFLFHPDEAALTEEAVARLTTLADYTELGSGFKIAMRDLEIRGAGELLGEEQSGQIAAVGFEMYLSMLQEATAELQGQPLRSETVARVEIGIDAHVPANFIGYEAARVDLHRRIASADDLDELSELREELRDRFGEIPDPVDNLIFLGEVRATLQALGADSFSIRQSRLVITGLALPPGSREKLRELDRRYAYAPVTGQLTLGHRGDERGPRQIAREVLDDILGLAVGETVLEH